MRQASGKLRRFAESETVFLLHFPVYGEFRAAVGRVKTPAAPALARLPSPLDECAAAFVEPVDETTERENPAPVGDIEGEVRPTKRTTEVC